jgi:hypothetical protein
MSTFDYIETWHTNNATLVARTISDPKGILTTEYGHKKGAYLVSVLLTEKNILIPMYAGEAGEDGGEDGDNIRTIQDRLKEHLYHWLGAYTQYHTGVAKWDLLNGKMKFHLEIVGEAESKEARKQMETDTILTKKPYLQYGPYKKYPSKYTGLDLCIVPWDKTRRKAFLGALKERGIEVEDNSRLIDLILNKSITPDWVECSKKRHSFDKEQMSILKQEMSEEWTEEEYSSIVDIVNEALGYGTTGRGVSRNCLLQILTVALS